jgi:hypothetical protein
MQPAARLAGVRRVFRRGIAARLGGVLLALWAGDVADAARASAQPAQPPSASSRVLVREQRCEPARYDPNELWRLLDLELASLGLRVERLPTDESQAAAALADAAAVIAIECGAGSDVLALRVSDLVSGKQLTRELSVADVSAAARPRAVALSAAALLESSLSELLAAAAPSRLQAERALPPAVEQRLRERLLQNVAPESAGPASIARRRARAPGTSADPRRVGDARAADTAPAERPPRAADREASPAALRLDLGAQLRAFPGRSTGLLGLSAGLAPALGRALRLTFGAEALYGKSDLADAAGKIGVMNLYWLAGGLGLAWLAAGSPAFELGPRVLAGFALADADIERTGATASSESGFVLALLLAATARWSLGASAHAVLGAEIGYTPVGVVFLGDQARLSGMADTTFALRIGTGWP